MAKAQAVTVCYMYERNRCRLGLFRRFRSRRSGELEPIERAPTPLRDRLPERVCDVIDRYRHRQPLSA
jgi:hypothetical protein